jgi:hypothetical protein
MAYYENPGMLAKHLAEWTQYDDKDKARLSAVLVDDGSPRNPAEAAIRAHGSVGFPITLLRVLENKPWNQDGARNLAMKIAEGWTLMTDMDHMLTRYSVGGLLECVKVAKRCDYYMPQRVDQDGAPEHPHPNSFVMHVDDFWSMGGYDEDFSGVYGSDGNFRKCMRAGLREMNTTLFCLKRYGREAVPDASTTDWGRKESPYHRSRFPKLEAKSRGPAYRAKDHLRFPWERVI